MNAFRTDYARGLIARGKDFVKPGREELWEKYAENNTGDLYGIGIIEEGIKVMEALTKGETPEKAMAVVDPKTTGSMEGAIAHDVSRFHTRGEEFRRWWNASNGAPDSNGVINPALLKFPVPRQN